MKGVSLTANKETYLLLAEALRMSGSLRMSATGTSMVPAIHPGDVITIQPIEASEVAIGDVVVYAKGQTLVVHRVVRKTVDSNEGRLVTRGDRLLKDDEPFDPSELLGRVIRIDRRDKQVSLLPVSRGAQQTLCQVLRRSDRATSVFLRASAFWNGITFKGNAGQA